MIRDFAWQILNLGELSTKLSGFTSFEKTDVDGIVASQTQTNFVRSSIASSYHVEPVQSAYGQYDVNNFSYPARGPAIQFQNEREKFPSLVELKTELGRARALHFFANHELLAIELFAWAICRFKDAPESLLFKWIETIHQEQSHLKLYIHRMAELGLNFGELPLNSFFWDHFTKLTTIDEFMAHMALTVEQANLDHCVYYGRLFRECGDVESAKVMGTVFRDEVEHVKLGVNWLQQSQAISTQALNDGAHKSLSSKKDSDSLAQEDSASERPTSPEQKIETLWHIYKSLLKFPFTPARAKGRSFAESARKQSGIDPEFIKNLRVYSASKGRVPDVHWMNLDVDMWRRLDNNMFRRRTNLFSTRNEGSIEGNVGDEAARLSATRLAKEVRSLEQSKEVRLYRKLSSDLETLLIINVKKGDIQLVRQVPDLAWREQMMNLGFELPEYVEITDENDPASVLCYRRTADRKWWGHSQALSNPKDKSKNLEFFDHSHLFSRKLIVEVKKKRQAPSYDLKELLKGNEEIEVIESVIELETFLSREITLDWIAKGFYSTSGRDQVTGHRGRVEEKESQTLRGIMKRHGGLVVEPFRSRVIDFSFQFERSSDGNVRFVGLNRFLVTTKGQYFGAWLGDFYFGLEKNLRSFLLSEKFQKILEEGRCHFAKVIDEAMATSSYVGPLGLDAFFWIDNKGEVRLHLCEVNVRNNFGYLTLKMKKYLRKQKHSVFVIAKESELPDSFEERASTNESGLTFVKWTSLKGDPNAFQALTIGTNDESRFFEELKSLGLAEKVHSALECFKSEER